MHDGQVCRSLGEALSTLRSELREDFTVNRFPAARATLAIWRAGMCLNRVPGPASFLARRVVQIADAVWIRGLMGSELPTQVRVGPKLRIPHAGRSIMVHNTVTMGRGCTLYHGTTVGVRNGVIGPTLGDDVYVGTGAVVIGPITVAGGTRVGANAVVLTDTEPGTWVGVPARRVAD